MNYRGEINGFIAEIKNIKSQLKTVSAELDEKNINSCGEGKIQEGIQKLCDNYLKCAIDNLNNLRIRNYRYTGFK